MEDSEYLRDQRAKKGLKGSFQLGPVDKAAVKRDKRTWEEDSSWSREITKTQKTQKQQEVDAATFASTSHNICFESGWEELEEPSSSEAEELKPVKEPSGT